MLFAGFNVSEGKYSLFAAVAVGSVANLVGSWIAYAVGYYGRLELLERHKVFHVKPEHLAMTERWFESYGSWAVFFSRMLPIVRTFISLPAGAARMPFWRFSVLTLAGCVPWILMLTLVGKAARDNWDGLEGPPALRRLRRRGAHRRGRRLLRPSAGGAPRRARVAATDAAVSWPSPDRPRGRARGAARAGRAAAGLVLGARRAGARSCSGWPSARARRRRAQGVRGRAARRDARRAGWCSSRGRRAPLARSWPRRPRAVVGLAAGAADRAAAGRRARDRGRAGRGIGGAAARRPPRDGRAARAPTTRRSATRWRSALAQALRAVAGRLAPRADARRGARCAASRADAAFDARRARAGLPVIAGATALKGGAWPSARRPAEPCARRSPPGWPPRWPRRSPPRRCAARRRSRAPGRRARRAGRRGAARLRRSRRDERRVRRRRRGHRPGRRGRRRARRGPEDDRDRRARRARSCPAATTRRSCASPTTSASRSRPTASAPSSSSPSRPTGWRPSASTASR